MTTAVAICPLDVVKTRIQASSTNALLHTGVIGSVRSIVQQEGVAALYRGLSPTLFSLMPSWALYFSSYETIKNLFENKQSWSTHLVSSVGAGAINAVALAPLWTVRTRLQTQTSSASQRRYRGMVQCLVTIAREEGLPALYRGVAPSLLGLVHVAVQFPTYEFFKARINHSLGGKDSDPKDDKHDAGPYAILFASVLSKIIASIVAYPHEVLRTRLQNHTSCGSSSSCSNSINTNSHTQAESMSHGGQRLGTEILMETTSTSRSVAGAGAAAASREERLSMLRLAQRMLRTDGLPSFYRGLGVNLIRVVPAAAITFTTYETTMHWLREEYP